MTKRKDPTVQRKKGGMDWPRGALTYLPLGHLTCNEILHWAKMQNIMCTCARTFSLSVGGGALPQSPIRALSLDHIRGLPTPCSRSCPSCIKWQWVPLVQSTVVHGLVTSTPRQTSGGSWTKVRFLVLQEFGALQVTKGTDSWLRDTDENFGPDLSLLFKMHKIWSVDSQEKF